MELTRDYPCITAAACKGCGQLDKRFKGWLARGEKKLASVSCDKDGMQIEYYLTRTRGDKSKCIAVSEHVQFTFTYPTFGGLRLWFTCPCCGRRCGTLYLAERPACRLCMRLAYACQMASGFSKGWALHSRWIAKVENGRPKGMHWRTYCALQEKIDDIAYKRLIEISGVLKKKLRRIGK